MREPYRSQFIERVRSGAGTQDIHDAAVPAAYAMTNPADEALVAREVERVALHQAALCPLLEATVGRAARVLDVGCGTGGTTVALALSPVLAPVEVVGVDPDRASLAAAEIRAHGHDLAVDRVRFLAVVPGQPLPFSDERFDLTVCVSVLEYIQREADRRRLIDDMKRVTRAGGHLYLATPSPYRLWSYHTGRFLGDFRRRPAHPWSSTSRQIGRMLGDWERVPLHDPLVRRALSRIGLPIGRVPGLLGRALTWFLPWQRFLVRKGR